MKRIIAFILLIIVTLLSVASCQKKDVEIKEDDIKAIGELASLECYYNNVAKTTKKGGILTKDRELWIEYEGVAKLGVDMKECKVEVKNDKVIISMPAAKIFSINPKAETLTEDSYYYSEDGFLFKNKITSEEQNDAIEEGQAEMRKAIEDNKGLLEKAENRCKNLIENYINKISDASGVKYEIVWKKISTKNK